MTEAIRNAYRLWCEKAVDDADLKAELVAIAEDENEIYERFYKELDFGTAGLRGKIAAGTNRMNIYTVRKTTQGLADWLKGESDAPSVAIAYDSRIKSDLFAREAARVLAGNGVKAYLFPELVPTPTLSFAVRYLHAGAGIMVTASHNPSVYNGYKCYGPDGCQMTDNAADTVTAAIRRLDMFDDVKVADYDEALAKGRIVILGPDVMEQFLQNVAARQVRPELCADAGLRVVYTPLHGTGNKPVREILSRIGVKDVTVVPEQELPDGNFPTVTFPNPEFREAFNCALKMAETLHPDLLLATDPDADRVGIAVRKGDGYELMTGNEVGCLMLQYLLSSRAERGTMPADPIMCKSIVTTDLVKPIAARYGCRVVDLLTGFKYIGEQILHLEEANETDRFILGFEESYGYLSGAYVRDKDAVVASMLICEMAAYYKTQGKSLLDVMGEIYNACGWYRHTVVNVAMEGAEGMQKMAEMMRALRTDPPKAFAGHNVLTVRDYQLSVAVDLVSGETAPIDLPKSNVIIFGLADGMSVVFRPSGTEPKIKAYITAVGSDAASAEALAGQLTDAAKKLLNKKEPI